MENKHLLHYSKAGKLFGLKPAAMNCKILELINDAETGAGPQIRGRGELVDIEDLRFALEHRKKRELEAAC